MKDRIFHMAIALMMTFAWIPRSQADDPQPGPSQFKSTLSSLSRARPLKEVLKLLANSSSPSDQAFIQDLLNDKSLNADSPLVEYWKGNRMRLKGVPGEITWHSNGSVIEYQGKFLRTSANKPFKVLYSEIANELAPKRASSSSFFRFFAILSGIFGLDARANSFNKMVNADINERVMALASALQYTQKYSDRGTTFFRDVHEADRAALIDAFDKTSQFDEIVCSKQGNKREARIYFKDKAAATLTAEGSGSSTKYSANFRYGGIETQSEKTSSKKSGIDLIVHQILDDICQQPPDKVEAYVSTLGNFKMDHRYDNMNKNSGRQ